MDPAAILERVLDEPRVARVRAVLDTYGHAAGGLLANGLAFSALFAAIPTLLLILGLAGWLANDPAARERCRGCAHRRLPAARRPDRVVRSTRSSQGAAAASIIGVVGLVWTVSQLYVSARRGVRAHLRRRPGARHRPPDRARLPRGSRS